jgi:hypothetical protein
MTTFFKRSGLMAHRDYFDSQSMKGSGAHSGQARQAPKELLHWSVGLPTDMLFVIALYCYDIY